MPVIDDSLKRFSGPQHAALTATVASLRVLLPGAGEAISYGMPTLTVEGIGVIALEGFKNHNSLFPMSGSVPTSLAAELKGCTVHKGTISFAKDKPLPLPLLRKIVKAKIVELNASYPKKSGEFKEFYDNGVLKAGGTMKAGLAVGAWRWFRRDGSLMRSGTFAAGEQAGEWVTYAAGGRVVKRTHFAKAGKPAATKAPAAKAAKKTAPKKASPKQAPATKSPAKKVSR